MGHFELCGARRERLCEAARVQTKVVFPAPGVRLINEMCKHSCSNIYSKQDTDSRNAHTEKSGLDL